MRGFYKNKIKMIKKMKMLKAMTVALRSKTQTMRLMHCRVIYKTVLFSHRNSLLM